MNGLLKLKEKMEIDFLKSKTYTEINEMFNELNDKLEIAQAELNKLRLDDVIKCDCCDSEIKGDYFCAPCFDEEQ